MKLPFDWPAGFPIMNAMQQHEKKRFQSECVSGFFGCFGMEFGQTMDPETGCGLPSSHQLVEKKDF